MYDDGLFMFIWVYGSEKNHLKQTQVAVRRPLEGFACGHPRVVEATNRHGATRVGKTQGKDFFFNGTFLGF